MLYLNVFDFAVYGGDIIYDLNGIYLKIYIYKINNGLKNCCLL